MTLGITIALVTAACAAVSGCTICYSTSKFESECHERGGHVRTTTSSQLCVMDAGAGPAIAVSVLRSDEDAGS